MSCAEGVAIDDGSCSRNSAREAARRNELEALTGYQAIKDAARGGARINPDRSGELRGDNGGRTEQPGLTGDPEFGGPTSVDGGLVGPPGNTGGNTLTR